MLFLILELVFCFPIACGDFRLVGCQSYWNPLSLIQVCNRHHLRLIRLKLTHTFIISHRVFAAYSNTSLASCAAIYRISRSIGTSHEKGEHPILSRLCLSST